MVNASLNWASIVGIVLAVGGALLYFMRSFKPALARDYDVFFAAVGLLCGGILFFQGWRLDPILQFGQFLLAGTTVFFAYESVRLRSVTTEQARRSSYFDDDEPPSRTRMGGGREWGEGVDRLDEPQPLRRRIRSREEGYGDQGEEEDFYRPRRPAARAAIPERAASRGGPREDWERNNRDRDRTAGPAAAGRERDEPSPSRFRAGAASGPSQDFGARRQGRDEQRRGSRPGSAPSEGLPRSSRRPGAEPSSDPILGGRPRSGGVPQGSPYQQRPGSADAATESAVSDADFSPIRPTGTPRPPAEGPRDNSSRFDD